MESATLYNFNIFAYLQDSTKLTLTFFDLSDGSPPGDLSAGLLG
jgi:hypothetical protein